MEEGTEEIIHMEHWDGKMKVVDEQERNNESVSTKT